MNTYNLIENGLKITNKRKQLDFFKEHKNDTLCFVFNYALNPFILFKVNGYKFEEPIHNDGESFDINSPDAFQYQWEKVRFLMSALDASSINKEKEFELIKQTSALLNCQQQKILRYMLDKKIGNITIDFVNLIFPKLINKIEMNDYCDTMDTIQFPCYAENYNNGKRVLSMVKGGSVYYFDRKGKKISNFDDLNNDLNILADDIPVGFDGILTKDNKGAAVYTIQDVMPISNFKRHISSDIYTNRRGRLKAMHLNYLTGLKDEFIRLRIPKAVKITSKESLQSYRQKNKGSLILKNMNSLYDFGESYQWAKLN